MFQRSSAEVELVCRRSHDQVRIINRMSVRRIVSVLLIACALPLLGAGRSRAVLVKETPYSARIVDAASGRAVVDAEVSSGGRSARTDVNGSFTLLVPLGRPTSLAIRRTGYEVLVVVITAQPSPGAVISPPIAPAPPAPLALTPRAPATITLTGGVRKLVDDDSIQFGYVLPFASPIATEAANFCRADGTAFSVHRSEIRSLTGPAIGMANKPCCPTGNIMRVTVLLKTGESSSLFFADSCAGYEIVIVARERESGAFVYLNVQTIEEVLFP